MYKPYRKRETRRYLYFSKAFDYILIPNSRVNKSILHVTPSMALADITSWWSLCHWTDMWLSKFCWTQSCRELFPSNWFGVVLLDKTLSPPLAWRIGRVLMLCTRGSLTERKGICWVIGFWHRFGFIVWDCIDELM